MKRFARLYAELDASTSTQHKVAALVRYLAEAPVDDAAWAVHLLCGVRPRQVMPTAELRALACEQADLPDWLFEECYQAVGDLAETIALLLPEPVGDDDTGLRDWMEKRLGALREAEPAQRREWLAQWWSQIDRPRRFLLTKLMSGGFRVGVSRLLVQRALAQHAGLDAKLIAERMMGQLDARHVPDGRHLQALLAPAQEWNPDHRGGQPYPFFLAHPLEAPPADEGLGPVTGWQAEWKLDGIRAQVVMRGEPLQVWVWSRGEELVTAAFPELTERLAGWPAGTVLDGEILVWPEDAAAPEPFAQLQRRLGRKTVTRRMLTELPVRFVAYDLLEHQGTDCRQRPLSERRALLERLAAEHPGCRVSPVLGCTSWADLAAQRQRARDRRAEGLMLKSLDGAYGVGRTRSEGVWWKWKLDPLCVDGVLIYAQAGHGRRASVYTDYTFAVWNRPPVDDAEVQACVDAIAAGEKPPADPAALQLVPFTKAYSGLTDAEFRQVDADIRRHTVNRFGPVRTVRPTLVFEIGFEGINASSRHRSGVALRFPRMLRIRRDKPLRDANVLSDLKALL